MTSSVAIVGCGSIAGLGEPPRGDSYLTALSHMANLQLVVAVDVDETRAAEFGRAAGCGYSTNVTEALERHRPDIVIVSATDEAHYELGMQALQSSAPPRALILEKPVCSSVQELEELLAASLGADCLTVVNHSRRQDPRYRLLRELVTSGRLGSPVDVRATYYGGWRHNGVHVVDTIRFVTGEEIEILESGDAVPSRFPADPSIRVLARLTESCARIAIDAVDESLYQVFEFDFRLTQGRIRTEDFYDRVLIESLDTSPTGESVLKMSDIELPPPSRSTTAGILAEVAHYLRSPEAEGPALVSLAEAAGTMEVVWEGVRLYGAG